MEKKSQESVYLCTSSLSARFLVQAADRLDNDVQHSSFPFGQPMNENERTLAYDYEAFLTVQVCLWQMSMTWLT